jgi:hypothetical protein
MRQACIVYKFIINFVTQTLIGRGDLIEWDYHIALVRIVKRKLSSEISLVKVTK